MVIIGIGIGYGFWNWIWFFRIWFCGFHWYWIRLLLDMVWFFQGIRIVSLKTEIGFLGFRICFETFISTMNYGF